MRLLVVSFLMVFAACSSDATITDTTVVEIELESISVPVSLYIVVSDTDDVISSVRTADDLIEIGSRMTEIWSQAGIDLEIQVVGEIVVPDDAIQAVADRDGQSFLRAAGEGRFEIPNPGAIVGFYVKDAGGANGFAPFGSRVFFVTDEPTVHDERVSSHEIGHLLGLHHAGVDADRLMFSGTNGMTLAPEEIATARYVAQGLLDGIR